MRSALPAAVRAEMPPGALSVSLFKMAPAPHATQFLFHLWTAARRDPEGGGSFGPSAGRYKGQITSEEAKAGGLRPSPFVLDIFSPGPKGQWEYTASVLTSGTDAPHGFALRYLDARKKEGYVLSTHDFVYHSGSDTLHVFPNGFEGTPLSTTFGYEDYMNWSRNAFPRDTNGVLQVVQLYHRNQATSATRTTLAWKDYKWQPVGEAVQVPDKPR